MPDIQVIARIRNQFTAKFGIPRQSGLVGDFPSTIVFERGFRSPDAVRGLDAFSYIWLLWGFTEAERENWSATVRPPRLGGNRRVGVFATRSPYRPSPIGLSSVRLERIERDDALGPVLHVLGADLMDGTPIYDIKPYLPFTDSHPDAAAGFADAYCSAPLRVEIDEQWLALLPDGEADMLRGLLAQDPRPSYQRDPGRVYGMAYGELEVKFSISGDVLTVVKIEKTTHTP